MSESISKINTLVTKVYLQTHVENQYFERKGLGEKDIKPTKIAEELIGMLNADGGTLVFGVADSGEIQDLKSSFSKDDLLSSNDSVLFSKPSAPGTKPPQWLLKPNRARLRSSIRPTAGPLCVGL